MRGLRRLGLASVAAGLLSACTAPHLAEFERTLAARDSATVALGEWCAARRIANPPTIRAEQVEMHMAPSPEVRRLLGSDELSHRQVRLACGPTVLSVASNWYVPGRLTPAMNRTLATTRTPFGTVASTLRFRRERLAARRGRAFGCPPATVLSHRALLRLPDGTPLSLVTECYTRTNLRP